MNIFRRNTVGNRFTPHCFICSVACAGVVLGGSSLAMASGGDDPVADMLKGEWGQIKIDTRYRLEVVDQDSKKSTSGDPLRVRIGYLTPKFSKFQAYAEFEGNTAVFEDDYNDKTNGKDDYAVIADPDSKGELNQGWVSYTGVPDTTVKVGRQRIILDNARFVGNVGWRQMEQTYDAVRISNGSMINLKLDLTYLWNVRNILSKDDNMDSVLINIGYNFSGLGKLTAYSYLLDYDDLAEKSSQTFGLRFNGSFAVSDTLDILYLAEYARQSDYQDNPGDFDVDYYHVSGGIKLPALVPMVKNLTAKIGYEFQGADNEISFKTPLGTNHAFGGWVDKFLATPDEGLKDFYGVLGGSFMGLTTKLIYHSFEADESGADYGTEFDAMMKYSFNSHYSVLAAYGNYDADELSDDAEKIWLQVTMKF